MDNEMVPKPPVRKSHKKIIIVSAVLLVLLGLVLFFSRPTAWNIFGFKSVHGLPCSELHSLEEVDVKIRENQKAIEEVIKKIGASQRNIKAEDVQVTWYWERNIVLEGTDQASYFSLEWGEPGRCRGTGKGDITFYHMGIKDKQVFQEAFGKTFFGIPYNAFNM
jgi:hypothetical protein